MRGRKPQPTILRLVRGDTNTTRFKEDKPKINDLPRVPPGVVLTEKERAMWDWLMEHVVMPGVHGTSDGAAFVKICRLWVRVMDVDAKIEEFGLLMKNPTTSKPELQPYTRLSRDLWHHLGTALADVGATPTGRVRLAGPMKGGGGLGDPTSWDDIK